MNIFKKNLELTETVSRIRTGFNEEPDPAFNLKADPDPGQTSRSLLLRKRPY